MSEDLRKDEENEVEGHRFPPLTGATDEADDEVEGHRYPPLTGASDEPEDEVEGHVHRRA